MMTAARRVTAFVSYTHFDDEYDGGNIAELARRLDLALRVFTGRRDLEVFVDRTSIKWGDAWRQRIAEGIAGSTILISVVTPTYLVSEECRREIENFLVVSERERWLLPIYYLEITDIDTRNDPISTAIRTHQCVDWRELRTAGRRSLKVKRSIEELATKIRDLLRGTVSVESSTQPVIPSDTSQAYHAQVQGDEWAKADSFDYTMAAMAALDDDEYGLARALLLNAMEQFEDPELVYHLATADWYSGALQAAVSEFEQAIKSGVDKIVVLQGLGQVRVELGDFDRGIADLTAVIERHPDPLAQAYARSTRALALGGIGRFREALKELDDAEQVTPDNAWLHFNRAMILDWQGDPAARASYTRSLIAASPALNRPKRLMAQRRLHEMERPT